MRDFPALLKEAAAEWETLLFPLPGGKDILAAILNDYNQVHRHYHTLEHIAEMTLLLAEYRDKISRWADVIFACLYHDIVYDAKRSDNEALSAGRCEADAAKLGIAQPQCQHIAALILATRKHELSDDSLDAKLFLDADLAILGASQERYERYAAGVRNEYSHVPEADYRAGRSAVLKKFLERPRLYYSDEMRARFETPARANIAGEIENLAAR